MKIGSLFFVFIICTTLSGQENLDSVYEVRINQKLESGFFDSALYYSTKWFTYGQESANDSIMALALRYYIEGCQKSKRYSEGLNALERLKAFTYSTQKQSEFPILKHATMFTYLFYKAEFYLAQKRVDSTKMIIQQLIKFVEDHTEFYRPFVEIGDLSAIYDLAQSRLNQAYLKLGECYMESKDYDKAYEAYVKSYEYAIQTDSIFEKAYNENNGRKILAIGSLLNFASVTKNDKLFEKWDNLNTTEDNSRYRSLNNKSSSISYLANSNDDVIKSKNIINQLKSSPVSKSDPTVLLGIINYYLRIGEYTRAIQELTYYNKWIHPERENINNKVDFHLAQAKTSMIRAHYPKMHLHIDKVKELIENSNMPLLAGTNSMVLSAYQTIAAIYAHAYEKKGEINLQSEIVGIGKSILPTLHKLKYTKEQGDDNSIVLKQAYEFVIRVLDAFYILKNFGIEIDYNVLFRYFELNKSFNLQNERLLRSKYFTKIQLEKHNKLILEIKIIEAQIKEDQNVDEDVMINLGRLKATRRSLVDSVVIPEMRAYTIKNLQDRLSENEVLIEYVLNENALYTFKIEKTRVDYFRKIYPDGKENLNVKIKKYRELTLQSYESINDSNWCAVSYGLFLELIHPFIIEGNKKLIIIPDAELNLISFQALLMQSVVDTKYRKWPYLIKKYQLITQQSAKFWIESNIVSDRNPKVKFYLFSPNMQDIKFHREECKNLYENYKNTILINEATKNTKILSGLAGDGAILHIATHAQSDPQFESKTFIRASRDTLKAFEIAYENFDHELIFLSACETGIGAVIKEEGVFSLARSFFKAGAQSVISTLWKINDKVSKDQVLKIYNYLSQGMQKDEALRQMQLDFINNDELPGKYAAPYYWAAYQCQGDLSPILTLKNKTILEKYFQSIILIFLTLAFIANQYFKRF